MVSSDGRAIVSALGRFEMHRPGNVLFEADNVRYACVFYLD